MDAFTDEGVRQYESTKRIHLALEGQDVRLPEYYLLAAAPVWRWKELNFNAYAQLLDGVKFIQNSELYLLNQISQWGR